MPEQPAMPDPMAKWTPAPDWTTAEIIREGWRARPVPGLTLTLIGGRLDLAIAALAPGAPSVGLWQIAATLPIALRIGRDKAMLLSTGEPVASAGWRDGGWTASDTSDALMAFEISGPAAPAIFPEAVSADIHADSASAAILFAGIPALLYRARPDVAYLHVESALAPYVWRWLEGRLG